MPRRTFEFIELTFSMECFTVYFYCIYHCMRDHQPPKSNDPLSAYPVLFSIRDGRVYPLLRALLALCRWTDKRYKLLRRFNGKMKFCKVRITRSIISEIVYSL